MEIENRIKTERNCKLKYTCFAVLLLNEYILRLIFDYSSHED
jgi:hypothetical protein